MTRFFVRIPESDYGTFQGQGDSGAEEVPEHHDSAEEPEPGCLQTLESHQEVLFLRERALGIQVTQLFVAQRQFEYANLANKEKI